MNIQEIVTSGGILLVLMTLIQVAPIKVNPWSAIGKGLSKIGKAIGRVFNGAVLQKLDEIENAQASTRQRLDDHIRQDNERNADLYRARILRFNTELLRGTSHTEEEFIDMLYNIDFYERYCEDHPEYQNNRAIHAIKNINRVYDDCMENHSFL